jgi:hypothetical protein
VSETGSVSTALSPHAEAARASYIILYIWDPQIVFETVINTDSEESGRYVSEINACQPFKITY